MAEESGSPRRRAARMLSKGETLRALASRLAATGPSSRREPAPWIGLGLEGEAWRGDVGLLAGFPDWLDEVGLLARAPDRYLVYLKPEEGRENYFPLSLVLRLGSGRYSIRSWDCSLGAAVGLEIAGAPPLVCSPPCHGSPLVLIIEALP